jgi:hypothetical protein
MNHNTTIVEQMLIEKFGEPLVVENSTKIKQKENWSDYKIPEKKTIKKKSGPKPKFWGKKHPKKAKINSEQV